MQFYSEKVQGLNKTKQYFLATMDKLPLGSQRLNIHNFLFFLQEMSKCFRTTS